jgi:hypothetical protein
MSKITAPDLQDMIRHWLSTPPNGYLGSGYGSPLKDMLQSPMKTGMADGFLAKLRSDVPLAGALPASALNMFSVDQGPDIRRIYIEASGQMVELGANK